MLKIGIVSLALLLGATAPAAAPGIAGKGAKETKEAKEAAKKGATPAGADKAQAPAGTAELGETGEAIEQAEAAQAAAAAESDPAKAAAKAVASARPSKRTSRPASKGEGKADRSEKGDKALAPPVTAQPSGATLPPSLAAPALQKELAANAKHAAGPETASEREKLEALSAELAKARAALQAETARLEALMKSRKSAQAGATPAPGGDPQPGAAPSSATMPIGDPMAPPVRPAYPLPPQAPGQVDVVSKAVKGMKPEQAAALIAHLDRGLAADVLQRMKPADAGAVLGFLRPEMGAALATEIANRPANNAAKNKNGQK